MAFSIVNVSYLCHKDNSGPDTDMELWVSLSRLIFKSVHLVIVMEGGERAEQSSSSTGF